MLFVPHLLLACVFLLWMVGLVPEPVYLAALVGLHLALPIWCACVRRSLSLRRRLLMGPGLLAGLYGGALVAWFLAARGGPPEGGWLTYLVILTLAALLAAWVAYCLMVFGIAGARQRRR